jgi:hypothetical protein
MTSSREQSVDFLLDAHLNHSTPLYSERNQIPERRLKPRVAQEITARIWGVDSDHEAFSYDGFVENISSSGLFLRLPMAVGPGSEISLVVRFLTTENRHSTAAINAKVVRVEEMSNSQHGVGVTITKYTIF